MPISIEARRLSGTDIGKTIAMYCRETRRSITTDILAIEHWPDTVRVWVPTDLDQDPYDLDHHQTVLISGRESPHG